MGDEFFLMTIDIGDGRMETIQVNVNNDANELSGKFCQKHGLTYQHQQVIAKHIYQNKMNLLHKKLANKLNDQKKVKQSFDINELFQVNQLKQQLIYNKAKLSQSMARERNQSPNQTNNTSQIRSMIRSQSGHLDTMMQKDVVKKDKIQRERKKQFSRQRSECTFSPKLSSRSQKLVQKDTSRTYLNTFESLYKDSEERNMRKEQYLESALAFQFAFKPQVSKLSIGMSSKQNESTQNTSLKRKIPIHEKLLQDYQQSQKKILEIQQRNKEKEEFDEHTNQKLFKPVICKSSEKRSTQDLSVGEYLHN